MKTKNFKKSIIIFSVILLAVLLFANFTFAQRQLEVQYPRIEGVEIPMTVKTSLPAYILYIFYFSLAISGFIAFAVFVYGGFSYLTSAGAPGVMSDARGRMLSSILGMVILFSAFLILNTLNPQLITLNAPGIRANYGVYLIDSNRTQKMVTQNLADIEAEFPDFIPSSISFFGAIPGQLEAIVYSGINYQGNQQTLSAEGVLPFSPIRSIELNYKMPGVYLCEQPLKPANDGRWVCDGKSVVYQSTSDSLGDFNDKARAVFFYNPQGGAPYGAVLHEHAGRQGECSVFDQDTVDLGGSVINSRASSITVFRVEQQPSGRGVTLYEKRDFTGKPSGPYNTSIKKALPEMKDSLNNDLTTSIKIEGNYLAVLFDNDNFTGKCEVFTQSSPNLVSNPIGQCYDNAFFFAAWNQKPCASAVIVAPTQP